MNDNIIYPPCRICGASHKMGVENTTTGEITPIDICYECLWKDFPFKMTNVNLFDHYTPSSLKHAIQTPTDELSQ